MPRRRAFREKPSLSLFLSFFFYSPIDRFTRKREIPRVTATTSRAYPFPCNEYARISKRDNMDKREFYLFLQ